MFLLIFPAIEHCLRRIFVCTNNCAEKALTAGKFPRNFIF